MLLGGGRDGGFDVAVLFVRPGRQQLYEDRQNDERQNAEDDGREQSFFGDEAHLVGGVSEEALGEELAANDDVPAHGEDTDLDKASSDDVDAAANHGGQLCDLNDAEQDDWGECADQELEHDLREIELGVDHEVEAAEALVGLVDAMDEVEHFETEVDDEDVEEVHRGSVDAGHVDGELAPLGGDHVEQHDGGNTGDHGGEDEDYGHQRRVPPGVGLNGAEDEADVSVEDESGWDADQGDNPADLVVDGEGMRADVVGTQRHHLIDQAQQPLAGLRQQNDLVAVVEPDLEDQDGHQVPHVDVTEHGHGRGGVGSEVHLGRALRVAKVKHQGKRRDDKEGQGGEQRQPVSGRNRLDIEDADQRREKECARDQPRDVGVQNDQHAPIESDFVGIHVAFNTVHIALRFWDGSEEQNKCGDSSLRSE